MLEGLFPQSNFIWKHLINAEFIHLKKGFFGDRWRVTLLGLILGHIQLYR